MSTFAELRQIALALPEAYEAGHFGNPSFRVCQKIFATANPEKNRATLKLDRDTQTMLFELRPDTFTPAVWGRILWATVQLEKVDAGELHALVRQAWEQVAPKRLIRAKT